MSKITVLGWFSHGNAGDEAYKIAFPRSFPNKQFIFSEQLETTSVILGGGNVCSTDFFDRTEKAKIKHAISVGITEKDPVERLKSFDKIYVRDHKSLEILTQNNIKASYFPDLTFNLKSNKNNGKTLIKKLFKDNNRDLYEKVVAVVLNSHLCVGDNNPVYSELIFNKIVVDLAQTFDKTSASFLFIPFSQSQPNDDRISNSWLSSKCKFWMKNYNIMSEIDPQAILDLISACDLTISTRLHSSIFSTIAGVPFIDVTHHSKNQAFLQSIGREDWSINYWDFSRKQLSDKINHFLDRSGSDHGLGRIVEQFRSRLKEINDF